MRVAITYSSFQYGQVTRWFNDMPAIPRAGETIHFDDQAWRVRRVSWVPDNAEPKTPGDTTWHAELKLR